MGVLFGIGIRNSWKYRLCSCSFILASEMDQIQLIVIAKCNRTTSPSRSFYLEQISQFKKCQIFILPTTKCILLNSSPISFQIFIIPSWVYLILFESWSVQILILLLSQIALSANALYFLWIEKEIFFSGEREKILNFIFI